MGILKRSTALAAASDWQPRRTRTRRTRIVRIDSQMDAAAQRSRFDRRRTMSAIVTLTEGERPQGTCQ